jgi:chemotaxis protein methyltransferase CheR
VTRGEPDRDERASADRACVEFLRWALPRLGLRWPGFRRVRRQVRRRLRRRLEALGLGDLGAYGTYLDAHPEEWAVLDGLTPITISRFYRDREVFARLEQEVLPTLAAGASAAGRDAGCWSAGCGSGEEAYTVALLWREAVAARFPGLRLEVLAADIEPAMLDRAREAAYDASSLKELPQALRERSFVRRHGAYVLRPEYRRLVTLGRHDLRAIPPEGAFDLVLCRNVAFTYMANAPQRIVLGSLAAVLRPAGALVIGLHESLPPPAPEFAPWPGARAVFRRIRPDPCLAVVRAGATTTRDDALR